jgi:hypothetical protein
MGIVFEITRRGVAALKNELPPELRAVWDFSDASSEYD